MDSDAACRTLSCTFPEQAGPVSSQILYLNHQEDQPPRQLPVNMTQLLLLLLLFILLTHQVECKKKSSHTLSI